MVVIDKQELPLGMDLKRLWESLTISLHSYMILEKEVGKDEIAKVYVARTDKGLFEFAESLSPPLAREEKWVIILSCLLGCPVQCLMCDAGQNYKGCLNKEEIFEQIDFLVQKRFPTGHIPVKKWKIQFTRMGEPAFNPAVLEVLEELPIRYKAPGLIPSVSTVGPLHCEAFFDQLTKIKKRLYGDGHFQMQFSIHTTDTLKRDRLIPIQKMSFEQIAKFGREFFEPGDRKITLNFIQMGDYPLDPNELIRFFDPALFLIKLTPLNPTSRATQNKLNSTLPLYANEENSTLAKMLKDLGYDVIVSIGEVEENQIGSNCGQYVANMN